MVPTEIEGIYPENLLSSLKNIEFVCPRCYGNLIVLKNGYSCSVCDKNYLLHAGIPDFRLFPDPFLTYKEDFERTEVVLSALEKYNFKELLTFYWGFSDITPEVLREKFVRSAVLGEQRASQTLSVLKNEIIANKTKILEIGCGTGNFLAAASSNHLQIIGIDIAMRWLHLSRRRFMDAGVEPPPLVCCNAEFLPFAANSFDLVVAASTLEFVSSQPKVFTESVRVLRENGVFFLNSVNRFSFAKDPYAYLWGVGFLPRKMQAAYVKFRRNASYENIRTLSLKEFDRLAEKYFLSREFILPDVNHSVLGEFSFPVRLQIKIYQMLKNIPLFSYLLMRFGPGWDVKLKNITDGKED